MKTQKLREQISILMELDTHALENIRAAFDGKDGLDLQEFAVVCLQNMGQHKPRNLEVMI